VGWIDIFSRQSYRDIVVDSFKFCQREKGLNVLAWLIMSNHVHCILSSKTGKLSGTIRDLKGFTSKEILALVESGSESRKSWMLHQFSYFSNTHSRNESYQLWTHENHAEELSPHNPEMAFVKLNYIHQNPVRAGIVLQPEHYLYSSALDYCGQKGLIDIDFIN
jgi:REP element-mobilizing transposase RayT